jgi:anti-anti-sigma regulatory factor
VERTAIDVDVLCDPPLVTVTGEVDGAVATELRTTLIGLLALGNAEVDVDLAAVEAVDPAVEELFSDVWPRGLVLHLRNPSPAAQALLHEAH